MRLAISLAGGALAVAACSSFGASDAALDAGEDGSADGGPPIADAAVPLPCPDASCGTLIASGQQKVMEVAADNSHVLWTIDTPGGFVRSVNADGTVTALASDDSPVSLQIYGTHFLYATGRVVRYAPLDDSFDGSTQAATPVNAGDNVVTSVHYVSNAIVFTRGNELVWCRDTGGNFGCGALPGISVPLGNDTASAVTGDPSSTNVWFATTTSIRSLDTKTFKDGKVWAVAGVRMLAVDDTQVFFIRTDAHGVFASPSAAVDASAVKTLAQPGGTPWALAVDEQNVYFTVLDQGLVEKVPKQGGDAVVIASGLVEPRGIALNDARVVVTLGDGRIVSLPK